MADVEMQNLLKSAESETDDPLDKPAPSALEYLSSLAQSSGV